jgi:hypothetical protein
LRNIFFFGTIVTPLDQYKHRLASAAGKPCRLDQTDKRVGRVVILYQLTWLEPGRDSHQFSSDPSVSQELTMSKQL